MHLWAKYSIFRWQNSATPIKPRLASTFVYSWLQTLFIGIIIKKKEVYMWNCRGWKDSSTVKSTYYFWKGSFILHSHIELFIASCNSIPRGSNIYFWLSQVPVFTGTYTYAKLKIILKNLRVVCLHECGFATMCALLMEARTGHHISVELNFADGC